MKKYLKIPFLFVVLSAAAFNAVITMLAKVIGEIFLGKHFNYMPQATVALFILAIVVGVMMLTSMNVAMFYYNNLDIIPCFHAFEMINKLICGQLLLNEIENYAVKNLLGLLGSTALIIIGIKIQTSKINHLVEPMHNE